MNSMHFSRNIHRINFLLIILDQANANTTPSAADVEVTEIYSSTPPQNVVSSDPFNFNHSRSAEQCYNCSKTKTHAKTRRIKWSTLKMKLLYLYIGNKT